MGEQGINMIAENFETDFETIKLDSDVILSNPMIIDNDVFINLDGKKITFSEGFNIKIIKDSSVFIGNGKIENDFDYDTIVVESGSKLILDNVNINSRGTSVHSHGQLDLKKSSLYSYSDDTNTTVINGKDSSLNTDSKTIIKSLNKSALYIKNGAKSSVSCCLSTMSDEYSTIFVEDKGSCLNICEKSSINSDNFNSIQLSRGCECVIDGGSISSKSEHNCIDVRNANTSLIINGGIIESNGNAIYCGSVKRGNNNYLKIYGGYINSNIDTDNESGSVIEIYGGVFTKNCIKESYVCDGFFIQDYGKDTVIVSDTIIKKQIEDNIKINEYGISNSKNSTNSKKSIVLNKKVDVYLSPNMSNYMTSVFGVVYIINMTKKYTHIKFKTQGIGEYCTGYISNSDLLEVL